MCIYQISRTYLDVQILVNEINLYNLFVFIVFTDIPHTDSYTKDVSSSHGKTSGDKSQMQTLTKFPRSDESDDEDRTDVCFVLYILIL